MSNIAILVGNTYYQNCNPLPCCHDDLQAMKELLNVTKKYATIEVVENADAATLRNNIRAFAEGRDVPTNELFFYFTGHGHIAEDTFYFCATDFDKSRPNQTGISLDDLHALLKLVDAELVVNVFDACFSGTRLVKSDLVIPAQRDRRFKNLIQISSSLDSQESFGGDPLSIFTEKFCRAATSKSEGPVFYMDVINALRDEFVGSTDQIPFFVSQITGRENFVEDASCFKAIRKTREERSLVFAEPEMAPESEVIVASTLLERLQAAHAKLAQRDTMENFIAKFFDAIKERLLGLQFADFWDCSILESSDFGTNTSSDYILNILSKEKRNDEFVTAKITRKRKKAGAFGISYLAGLGLDALEQEEDRELRLNCLLPRVQLTATFVPKLLNLEKMVLVISCAPSLDTCFVFEVSTAHRLTDFTKFEELGRERTKRWYKFDWHESSSGVVAKILNAVTEILDGELAAADGRV